MNTIAIIPLDREQTKRLPRPSTYFYLFLTLCITLLLFGYSGSILRATDPAAAVLDPGILSVLLLAMLAFFAFISISLWLSGLLWPVFRDYRKYHFSKNFKTLSPLQKLLFYLGTFFLLLYAFVFCLIAVV